MRTNIYRIQYAEGLSLVEATEAGITDHIAQLPISLTVVDYREATFDELMQLFSEGHYAWKQCEVIGCTNEADGLIDDHCQQCWEKHCTEALWQAVAA